MLATVFARAISIWFSTASAGSCSAPLPSDAPVPLAGKALTLLLLREPAVWIALGVVFLLLAGIMKLIGKLRRRRSGASSPPR